jgi:riboflavin synthase
VFTGIVRELGRVAGVVGVVGVDGGEGGVRLRIAAPQTAGSGVALGDSVAIGGVCLTVVAIEGSEISFDAVPETMRRTALGRLAAGEEVNVEPALPPVEPLGGHVMQGHVDGTGSVRSVEREGGGKRIWIDAAQDMLRYCVEKGSVAVDGVSLTVAELDDAGFAVALIPHTLTETTLGGLVTGDTVNLEVDVLAKYVERLLPSTMRR